MVDREMPAKSSVLTTSSLFDTGSSVAGGQVDAVISNIRHLENIGKSISGCGDSTRPTGNSVVVKTATQTKNLQWSEFRSAPTFDDEVYSPFGIVSLNRAITSDALRAVTPATALSYDGGYHSISYVNSSPPLPVEPDPSGNSGLFGELITGSSVKNLELIVFSVTGSASAGALAGTLDGCTVTNVLARGSGIITAHSSGNTGVAGGLIGVMDGGSVNYSAAAMIVKGDADAGGLIGTASGEITGCYSGGHTWEGSYEKWIYGDSSGSNAHGYDVIGATAGGLVGNAGSSTIQDSYSTCSVSGTTAGGGFIGEGNSEGSINNCYCTGRVDWIRYTKVGGSSDSINFGAFAGGTIGSRENCQYYEIVNEIMPTSVNINNSNNIIYLGAVHNDNEYSGIRPFDSTAKTYNDFVDNESRWTRAKPFDAKLKEYYPYSGSTEWAKYNLKSVSRLESGIPANYYVNTHYGDWTAPEIFIINN